MKVSIRKGEEASQLVELEGELDFHSSPQVRSELAKLADQQTPKILVDLKKVQYIDSSGLATFVELFQKMKRYGGKLALFNLSESVRSVFEIAKLDSIFKLARSEQEAASLLA